MTSESFAQQWPGRAMKYGRGPWAGPGKFGRGPWAGEADEYERGPRRHRPGGPGGPGGPRGHRAHRYGPWAFTHGHGPGGPGGPTPEEMEDLMAWRRMRGGPFGGPGGPFGRGPRGRGRGRARRGDVRLALLRLLAEEPSNGYQLMQTIEQRSQGRWSPSPGSVYPTLAQLEDEGLIRSSESEGSRRYEITDAGREHLETRAGEPDPWQPADEAGESAIAELGPLVIQIGKAAWQVASVGDEAQRDRAVQLLREARRGLYRILAEDPQQSDAGETDV